MMMQLLIAFVSGTYTSLWGAFKDSPYETFKPKTFPRSILFSLIIYVLLMEVLGQSLRVQLLSYVQLFFLVMGIERFISEIYKGFFRIEDQSKYFIPSRITFFGKHVRSNFLRYVVGVLIVAGIFALTFVSYPMQKFWEFCLVAYVTGLSVAFGGAYKDAPFEGFQALKFQRSGFVLLVLSPLFYYLGPVSLGYLIFMNIGLERFVVEYYKTYIKRNMSGKFKSDTQRIQKYLDERERYHYAAWLIILLVMGLYIYEITNV
ncbi:MAG: hypothetical protein KDD46_02655 [Bdellovibrionales bacterium]|nr:hypothetical protein [Bdellovibrionales bacterium]